MHEFLAPFALDAIWRLTMSAIIPFSCNQKPPPKPPDTFQERQQVQKANRMKLKGLLLAAATLPSITSAVGLQAMQAGITNSRAPKRHILDTSKLSGMNLEAVRHNLSKSSHLSPITLPNGSKSIPILIDTGASGCTSPSLHDFEPNSLCDLPQPQMMRGIGGDVEIKKVGILRYQTLDDQGAPMLLRCPGFYMPELQQRLFSPQLFFSIAGKGGELVVREDHLKFRLKNGQVLTLPLDPTSRLFYAHCFEDVQQQANALAHSMTLTNDANKNLSRGQKRLLRLHHALVHVAFGTIRRVGKLGWLGSGGLELGDPKADPPLCGTCQYAKAKKRSTGVTTTLGKANKEGQISKNKLNPGELVSMDHMVIKEFGRTFTSMGREAQDKMYQAATIFHDAASGQVAIKFQRGLSATETLRSKMEYERERLNAGVRVQSYRADNGTFTAQAMIDHIKQMDQNITFSGAGAQHQNANAERSIKTATEDTRAIMLHAALHWPEAFDPAEWPMAMAYAIDIRNSLPRGDSDFSPDELFTKSSSNHSRLLNAKAWGCPAYVLEPKLRDNGKLPKFSPKSRRGKFLGYSPIHSSTVGLIRNLRTGSITPQFHVVYDSEFETTYAPDETPPDSWHELIVNHRYMTPIDDDSPIQLAEEWLTPEEVAKRHDQERARARGIQRVPAHKNDKEDMETPWQRGETSMLPPAPEPIIPQALDTTFDLLQQKTVDKNDRMETSIKVEHPTPPEQTDSTPAPSAEPPPTILRRSKRVRFRSKRYPEGEWGTYADLLSTQIFAHSAKACYSAPYSRVDFEYVSFLLQDWENGFQEGIMPHDMFAFKAKKGNDPDSPTFNQAMASPEQEYWLDAIRIELSDLTKRETWIEFHEDSLPEGANVVPGTWAFKVKRYPDGRFRKFKARFCVRGDKQLEGIDYFKTYAPVVSWISVRTCLILSSILKLKTVQADYSNAFAQAFLEEEIYLKLPQGCTGKHGKKTVLKLQRSLYGLKQAAACWFDKLRDGLISLEWTQPLPSLEPCLFVKDKVICLIYVDDCLFFGADDSKIRSMIHDIENAGFTLTVEEDVYAFLGVEVKFDDGTGTVTLLQPGLIAKIIRLAQMDQGNSKATPAEKDPLGPGTENDPAHSEEWSYPTMIGCLMYLANNTRPDIQYAVHACARYTHRPKHIHSTAVKRIVRYLIGTADKGMIFRPNKDITLDMYVDADFAGMWHSAAETQDPVRVKSRTGYIILLAGCPLLWCSKLQTEIATSTLEAEFIALSSAMRDLIPTREIFQTLSTSLGLNAPEGTALRSTVFEDNNGCLQLASVPKITPRTKHIGVKYFWFRSKVGPDSGIKIVKVNSENQLADTFTKGLAKDQFINLRNRLMGWSASVREGVLGYEPIITMLMSLWQSHVTNKERPGSPTIPQDSWWMRQIPKGEVDSYSLGIGTESLVENRWNQRNLKQLD